MMNNGIPWTSVTVLETTKIDRVSLEHGNVRVQESYGKFMHGINGQWVTRMRHV